MDAWIRAIPILLLAFQVESRTTSNNFLSVRVDDYRYGTPARVHASLAGSCFLSLTSTRAAPQGAVETVPLLGGKASQPYSISGETREVVLKLGFPTRMAFL